MRLSIIIPALNEAQNLCALLTPLQTARQQGVEIILVDGGSFDETVSLAHGRVDRLLKTQAGRALQMNAGAEAASGDVLLFLHADCRLPEDFHRFIQDALVDQTVIWGYFPIRLTGRRAIFRLIERLMNYRTRLSGMVTGDMAMFVRKSRFNAIKGFPEIALMEDLAISKNLKKHGRPIRIAQSVIGSSRHWEQGGIYRTILKMWLLRAAYFFGAPPGLLEKFYYADKTAHAA